MIPNHRLNVQEFFEGQKVDDTDVHISAFEKEVRECGFMSFDTEGGGNLPSKDKTKEDRRVFIAMSSPKTGRVLLFHCLNDVPKLLLSLLSDYAIAKIQSNIAADVKILDDRTKCCGQGQHISCPTSSGRSILRINARN